MRVLVTGATGFLGKQLVISLIELGYDVVALGRNPLKLKELERLKCKPHSIDLLNKNDLKNLSISIDIVFHCAAFSSPWGKRKDFIEQNVNATKNILDWSIENNAKRFIYVSSSSVYFDYRDKFMISEDNNIAKNFANPYSESKFLGEQLCQRKEYSDLETIIIRPRGIIGEGDTSIIPRIMQVAARGSFPLINNGQALVDVTYVGNVVEAILLAAKTEHIGGQCFNISNDQPMTVKALLNITFDALDYSIKYKNIPYNLIDSVAWALESWSKVTTKKEPIITRYGVGLITFSQTLDISKAQKLLTYRPLQSIEQGIQHYVQGQED